MQGDGLNGVTAEKQQQQGHGGDECVCIGLCFENGHEKDDAHAVDKVLGRIGGLTEQLECLHGATS
jgi:hypothetical protein